MCWTKKTKFAGIETNPRFLNVCETFCSSLRRFSMLLQCSTLQLLFLNKNEVHAHDTLIRYDWCSCIVGSLPDPSQKDIRFVSHNEQLFLPSVSISLVINVRDPRPHICTIHQQKRLSSSDDYHHPVVFCSAFFKLWLLLTFAFFFLCAKCHRKWRTTGTKCDVRWAYFRKEILTEFLGNFFGQYAKTLEKGPQKWLKRLRASWYQPSLPVSAPTFAPCFLRREFLPPVRRCPKNAVKYSSRGIEKIFHFPPRRRSPASLIFVSPIRTKTEMDWTKPNAVVRPCLWRSGPHSGCSSAPLWKFPANEHHRGEAVLKKPEQKSAKTIRWLFQKPWSRTKRPEAPFPEIWHINSRNNSFRKMTPVLLICALKFRFSKKCSTVGGTRHSLYGSMFLRSQKSKKQRTKLKPCHARIPNHNAPRRLEKSISSYVYWVTAFVV